NGFLTNYPATNDDNGQKQQEPTQRKISEVPASSLVCLIDTGHRTDLPKWCRHPLCTSSSNVFGPTCRILFALIGRGLTCLTVGSSSSFIGCPHLLLHLLRHLLAVERCSYFHSASHCFSLTAICSFMFAVLFFRASDQKSLRDVCIWFRGLSIRSGCPSN